MSNHPHKTSGKLKGDIMQSTTMKIVASTQQRRRSKKMISSAGSVFMVLVVLVLSIYLAQRPPPTQQRQQQHDPTTTITRETTNVINTETTSTSNTYSVVDEPQQPQAQPMQQTEDSDIQLVRSYPSSDYCHHLRVIDNFLYQGRFLQCDNVILGATSLEDKSDSLFRVFHEIVAIILAASSSSRRRQKHGGNALLLGMGAGSVVGMLEANSIQTHVVEINPHVIDAASQFFQISPSGNVYAEDAVTWLESPPTSESIYYDVIVHDVFTTGAAYTQLYNVHIFTRLKQHLRLPTDRGSGGNAGAGIVIVNFVGYHQGPHRFAALSIYRSLLHVFEFVRCFRDEQIDVDPLEQGNLLFVASSQPVHFLKSEHDNNDRDDTSQEYIEPNTPDWIMANFHRWEVNFDQELRMLLAGEATSEEWRAPLLHSPTDFEVFRNHSGPIHDDIFRAIRHLLPLSKWTL